jgi:hypothetical protein
MVTASTFSFESEPNSIYTGSVRACGVGGTTSVVTLEGVYR